MSWKSLSQATKQTIKIPNKFLLSLLLVSGVFVLLFSPTHVSAAAPTVVKPSAMNGWYFWNDKNDIFTGSPGELVSGPASPPLGVGSVRLGPLTDNGVTAAGHSVIATDAYFGDKLADITNFNYSTYQPGPTLAIALQFDVRYRTTDSAYGGRLVFEPYQNGAVTVGSGWQLWSPLAGTWWASKTTSAGTGGAQVVALPTGNCAQATPCTWAQINAAFPDAKIFGRLLLKAGSNWNGFDGNADALTVGVSGTDTTFDFEQETTCTTICHVNAVTGNDAFGGDTLASAKKTIQAAINQVSTGGTVNVAAGIYDEQVVINGKSLTIVGTGDTTIIRPTSAGVLSSLYTLGAQGGAFWNGDTLASIIKVSGVGTSGVTIKNLKVDGENITGAAGASYVVGISLGETGGLIDGVTIEDMNYVDQAIRTYGIWLDAVGGTDVSVEVTNSTINYYNKNGINARGNKLTVNIHDNNNTIHGPGQVAVQVPNGILLINGAGGTIRNNTITDNQYTGDPQWKGSGILLYAARDGIAVLNNNIHDTDDAVLVHGTNLAVIETNHLHGNLKGVQLESGAANNSITGNTVTDNTYGIFLDTDAGVGNTASNNSITGSVTLGVNNLSANDFVAINNYWGPVHPTFESIITEGVTYDPWYTNAAKTILSNTLPVISLTGDNSLKIYEGTTYTDPGATATDNQGNSITVNITNLPNTNVVGTYAVTYNAQDSFDNNAVQVTRTVEVLAQVATQIPIAPENTVSNDTPQVVIGDNAPATSTITVPAGVTDASLDVSAILTSTDGTNTATLAGDININSDTSVGSVTVAMPAGLTITGPSSWDGTINLPKVVTTTVTLPVDPGFTPTTSSAIEVGFGDIPLTFDQPVRLVFSGQAGQLVGWSRSSVFTLITARCTADSASGMPAGASECKIDVNGEADLAVWTKHFTTFVTYNQTPTPASAPTTTTTSSKPARAAARGTGGGVLGESSNAQIATPLSTTIKELPAAVVAAPAVEKAGNLKWYWYAAIAGAVLAAGAIYYVYQAANKNKTDKES